MSCYLDIALHSKDSPEKQMLLGTRNLLSNTPPFHCNSDAFPVPQSCTTLHNVGKGRKSDPRARGKIVLQRCRCKPPRYSSMDESRLAAHSAVNRVSRFSRIHRAINFIFPIYSFYMSA